MKIRKHLRPAGLIALGVFLGRGAHADTTLDFNSLAGNCTPPQVHNTGPPGITNFGNYISTSSPGITVSGFGTPNIGLRWSGSPWPVTHWEYYNDSDTYNVWSAAQLDSTIIGSTDMLTFIPNNASARVVIESFNFHPYYNDPLESYAYKWSVVAGASVLATGNISFTSDGVKHPVNINYTGAPGQPLKLKLLRTGGTDSPNLNFPSSVDLAVDDIKFAQLPATTFPAGPQVVTESDSPVSPHDGTAGFPATLIPPYFASITNGDTTVVASSIQLKLDGTLVSPPPTISTDGVYTNVTYAGATAPALLSSGTHLFTLTYADNLGAFYTNEVEFGTPYAILPAAYASPPGSGSHPGFTWRSVLARQDMTKGLASSVARAVAQLNGTLVDPDIGGLLTNAVPNGTNADGSFDIDGVINFDDDFGSAGNFQGDTPFPGLDLGAYNWFSCEGLLFLDLPAGYYRFGVNSDDGFEFNALPPKGVSGSLIVLGIFDGGRASSDTLFDFLVPTSGVYPFQLIYFESQGQASCELFSVDIATTNKFLINDLSTNAAIKSFRVIPPRITNIVRSGSNVSLNWAYGNPPFQVQFKNNITGPWSNSGSPTSNRTALVPIQPGAGFIRIVGSP